MGWSIANWMFFKRVRKAMGLDRCHFPITGAAPIRSDVLDYFMSVNIPIHELYGMSETSGTTITISGCLSPPPTSPLITPSLPSFLPSPLPLPSLPSSLSPLLSPPLPPLLSLSVSSSPSVPLPPSPSPSLSLSPPLSLSLPPPPSLPLLRSYHSDYS